MTDKKILEELERLRKIATDTNVLVSLFVPSMVGVSTLAKSLNRDPKTIRVHLEGNFIKDRDYFQSVERGKIEIPLKTALEVANYYRAKGV